VDLYTNYYNFVVDTNNATIDFDAGNYDAANKELTDAKNEQVTAADINSTNTICSGVSA